MNMHPFVARVALVSLTLAVLSIGATWVAVNASGGTAEAGPETTTVSDRTLLNPSSSSDAQTSDPLWQILMQAGFEEVATPEGRRWLPNFPPDVEELDGTEVRLSGFMIPLGLEEKQTHFLLSAYPGHGCYFHLPGGPSAVVEVQAARAAQFTYDTIAIEGRLELLHDDPYGLLFRMTEARPVR